tara:strand:- start:1807 stop:4242 length:2436 start_codon:yes stop_codon:yes gene_type:complete
MRDVKIDISSAGFPSQFVSDAEKATDEFGLQIGQAIQYEWFKKDGSGCRYYDQWRDFHRLRLYARGEQSVAKYKNELAVDGDLSYLNLDWTPVPILPKFVDIVVNGLQERQFVPKAFAQDAMSQSKRSKYQQMIEGQMLAKPLLQNVQAKTGFDPFSVDPDELPATDEELSLYMQLNYKPAIEIAEEEAINTLFEANKYNDIRKQLDYDQTVIGISCAKHEFLQGDGVKLSYVDPANVVYSYTDDPHFKDCFYWGEIKTVPIIELYKIDQSLKKEDLEEISNYAQSWYDYYNTAQYFQNDIFYRDTATLMYFNYKTTKKVVYKKKVKDSGSISMIEKDDSFNPPEAMQDEGKFEKVSKTIDVWYEGVMVMGTSIILQWKLMENMVRPQSASQYAIPNYVAVAPRMYKGSIESLVRRMIPFADLIQITHLKLQQVISRVVPDGVFIDADGLNEVDLGTGNAYNPEDALRLYFQTGSVIGRSYTQDGDYNQGRMPIKELQSSSGASKTQMLLGNYNHYLNQIRQVTGLNEARDASMPDSNSLVGLQKLAALNSNVATRHILDGGLYIYRTLAEAITYRVADILQYSEFKEQFINQIGKYNVSILGDIADLYIYDFGIFIELSPDEEQKAMLEQNIQMALSKGDINLEDAIDIREIRNLKLANQLLKMKRIAKQEQEQKQAMAQQQAQAQAQQQSQEMAAQMGIQKIQMETKAKIEYRQADVMFEIEKMKNEAMYKSQLMQEEFNLNMQLRGVDVEAKTKVDKQKEDGKAERIGIQNTQQSKLIQQRKNNLPPINFESNEDSLDGFDFAEFNPR